MTADQLMTSSKTGATPGPGAAQEAAIAAIARMTAESVRRTYPPGTIARRDAHPKHHGIVRAEFRVSPDIPAGLRHGLFATPRTYPAWIRFSNGSPQPQADAKRDQRGMAIKLLDVPGRKLLEAEADAPTQDFVLANCPRFFIRNVADYVAFTRAASRPPRIRLLGYFFGRLPWRLHELGALLGSLQPADDLLRLRYWSQTPYALGPLAVKYSARPLNPPAAAGPGATTDFLRERLSARLASAEATFEFLVQPRTMPDRMSIEDSTIEWDERDAPFTRMATIHIPAQTFTSPAQMALAEQISYTPWHALPEHAPLGSVNLTRRAVYDAVSRVRHELNGIPRREPTSLDLPSWAVQPDPSPASSSWKDRS